jgi:DNA-binding response OmpR family regulator
VSDIMMPRVDGLELVRLLREAGWDTPILMLTARQDSDTLHNGFIAGADDYLTKPVDMKELVLRVRALLRRSGVAQEKQLCIGATVLDATRNTVTRAGVSVELPPKEFQLLHKLLANPGRAYTRMQLLDDIWGWDSNSTEATGNVHINRLRNKFESWPDFEIRTVRGIGYCAEDLSRKDARNE